MKTNWNKYRDLHDSLESRFFYYPPVDVVVESNIYAPISGPSQVIVINFE